MPLRKNKLFFFLKKAVNGFSESLSVPNNVNEDPLSFDITKTDAENEVDRFLNDSSAKTLIALNNYPNVKMVFIKFNTALPSSGPVERLFSIASLVLT